MGEGDLLACSARKVQLFKGDNCVSLPSHNTSPRGHGRIKGVQLVGVGRGIHALLYGLRARAFFSSFSTSVTRRRKDCGWQHEQENTVGLQRMLLRTKKLSGGLRQFPFFLLRDKLPPWPFPPFAFGHK